MLTAGLFARMPAGAAKVWYGADAASFGGRWAVPTDGIPFVLETR